MCKAHWPTYKDLIIDIPPQILEVQNSFLEFYTKKNQFRGLEWIYSLGTIILDAKFEKGKYEITMTMPQYSIITILETRNYEFSFEELLQKTKLDEETLKKNLHSLVTFFINKILIL